MPTILVTLVLFGLFCGCLAVVGMIADKVQSWANGSQPDNYPVHHVSRAKLNNFPR